MGFYSVLRDLYSSKTASEITSEVYWIGDAETFSLFLRGSPSTTTVQGSLADGRAAAIAEASWSNLTTVLSPSPDLVDVTPFSGWMRLLRSETTEATLRLRNKA